MTVFHIICSVIKIQGFLRVYSRPFLRVPIIFRVQIADLVYRSPLQDKNASGINVAY